MLLSALQYESMMRKNYARFSSQSLHISAEVEENFRGISSFLCIFADSFVEIEKAAYFLLFCVFAS